jgi:hypothetical protein
MGTHLWGSMAREKKMDSLVPHYYSHWDNPTKSPDKAEKIIFFSENWSKRESPEIYRRWGRDTPIRKEQNKFMYIGFGKNAVFQTD